MRYVDTSVFVPLFMPEATSATIRSWFQRLSLDEIAISAWTLTEFASALGGKVRSGAANAASASAALTGFADLVSANLRVIAPLRRDFEAAADLLQRFELGLRAGDALHVAITRNHRAEVLVTLDMRLAVAAGRLGLACEMPA